MPIEWVKPTAEVGLFLYKNRGTIAEFLATGLDAVLGKRTVIVVTGMEGVGKTVLADHLTGKAFRPGYSGRLPRQSQKLESGSVSSDRQRIGLEVIPGQQSYTRRNATSQLFGGEKPVHGIIHIVANGLATVRDEDRERQLVRDAGLDTIEKIRAHQLAEELVDLKDTCRIIRDSHQRVHAPNWLLVVVDKVDLYHDRVLEARDYYSPYAENEFTRQLNDLTRQVGSDYFRWSAIPACTTLVDHTWNRETLKHQLDTTARDAYLGQLMAEIANYSN